MLKFKIEKLLNIDPNSIFYATGSKYIMYCMLYLFYREYFQIINHDGIILNMEHDRNHG